MGVALDVRYWAFTQALYPSPSVLNPKEGCSAARNLNQAAQRDGYGCCLWRVLHGWWFAVAQVNECRSLDEQLFGFSSISLHRSNTPFSLLVGKTTCFTQHFLSPKTRFG